MGTTQMFYALTQREEDYFVDHMNKFVALAPCVYLEETSYQAYHDGIGYFRQLGINVIYGPDWD